MTQIEWTHLPGFKGESWNPIVGCSIVSKGCTNCYAMKQAGRILRMTGGDSHYAGTVTGSKAGPVWTGKVARASDDTLTAPLRARKPRCYFVNSMGDLFAEGVPDEWIDQVFAVMALAPEHRFIVLTKRPERMRRYLQAPADALRSRWGFEAVSVYCATGLDADQAEQKALKAAPPPGAVLPNVWLGVSVEDQASADVRIPLLLDTPAAVRFISAEPLLGLVDLESAWHGENALEGECWGDCGWCKSGRAPLHNCKQGRQSSAAFDKGRSGLDWVITGGESGPDARPMHPDWARCLRDQCAAAGVPFFFKQWGEWVGSYPSDPTPQADVPFREWNGGVCAYRVGKKAAGHLLDGVEHFNWPDDPAGGAS